MSHLNILFVYWFITNENISLFLQFAIGSLMDDYLGKYYTKHFPIMVICLVDKTFLDSKKGLDF